MPDILETNQGTLLKFDIKSDRSEPQMDVEFSKLSFCYNCMDKFHNVAFIK